MTVVGTDARWHAGPGRAGAAARGARAVCVVALLCIAALGVQGRRGLDWDRITAVPDVAWARVLLGAIGVALGLAAARQTARMLRRPAVPPPEEDAPPVEPRRLPWAFWVAAAAVVAGIVWAIWWLMSLVLRSKPGTVDNTPITPSGRSATGVTAHLIPLLFGLLAVLAVAGLALLLSRRAAAAPGAAGEVTGSRELDQATLGEALAAAGDAMEVLDDNRAAIVAAYTAMERRLARRTGHRPSDTPSELLDRAVLRGLVSGGPAAELTELFREARFSTHPLGPDVRRRAESALSRASAELMARRA
jgi:hypothetical protein